MSLIIILLFICSLHVHWKTNALRVQFCARNTARNMFSRCLECKKLVRKKQHAVACDVCQKWQHRTCGTGIDRQTYFAAIKLLTTIKFVCRNCVERIPPVQEDVIAEVS